MKTAYIISLKFAPGLKKEFGVLGENIRRMGFNVKYLISNGYRDLEGIQEGVEYITEAKNLKDMIFETLKFIRNNELINIFFSYPPI